MAQKSLLEWLRPPATGVEPRCENCKHCLKSPWGLWCAYYEVPVKPDYKCFHYEPRGEVYDLIDRGEDRG